MNLDEYSQMYEREDHYWWFVARRELALKLLRRCHGKILDVGCGTGALMSALPAESFGVDFSPEALRHCAKRGLRRVTLADAENLPLLSESVSGVVTLDTLEHVADDRAAISEIHRVLAPGGHLVLNVPAFRWLWGPHDIALHHHRRYTKGEVLSLLESAGFHVDLLSYSVFFLFPLVVGVRLLDRLLQRDARVRLPEVGTAMNRVLIWLMRIEGALLQKIPLPVGSSVVAVARK